MPFPFAYLCDLLEQVSDSLRGGPKVSQQLIKEWFHQHRRLVDHANTDKCALLSCLLPELRTDRVYGIKEATLTKIIARAWGLGSRDRHLKPNTEPGSTDDLAEAVERTLKASPNEPTRCHLSLETIDRVLERVAANYRFSSPAVRSLSTRDEAANNLEALRELYRQVTPREAKWLTRMILKNYEPVVLDAHVIYQGCHKLLPCVMKIHDNFAVAMGLLQDHERNSGVIDGILSLEDIPSQIKPALGVKVGRQNFIKGRTAEQCVEMGFGIMSCEQKMDGEYCQIHVDLEKGNDKCIQIFSKSGKDSTDDRVGLHSAIKTSLRIGEPTCKVKRGCILEGELLAYNALDDRILGFEKIRKYVRRSGGFIGTEQDSQPHDYEHLMIVYYDVLMINDESLLSLRHSKRFQRLEDLVQCIPGQSELVTRQLIDFSSLTAVDQLNKVIARCAVRHEEGLVLKADDPYFDFSPGRRRFSCSPIKYKTGYDPALGEIGDFAVVGARYDPAKAKEYYDKIPNLSNLKWTHFYLGCLLNKEGVQRREEKPNFKVVAVVEISATNMRYFLHRCWTGSTSVDGNEAIILQLERGIDEGRRPSTIFTEPAVFDISSFNFHKEGNTNFWSPRWPSVTKIHLDRSYIDCLTFSELQEKAEAEMAYVEREESQKVRQYLQRLRNGSNRDIQDPEGYIGGSQQSISGTRTTPSRWSPLHLDRAVRPSVAAAARSIEPYATTRPVTTITAAPLTPPRSSLPEQGKEEADELVEIIANDFHTRKRARDADRSTPRRKQRRLHPGTPVSSSPEKPASQPREPLGEITTLSSSQRDNVLWKVKPGSSTTHEARLFSSNNPQGTPRKEGCLMMPLQTASSASCRYPGQGHDLANCVVLLSPCVAALPLVAKIRESYGVTGIFTDPALWRDAYSERIQSKLSGPSETRKPKKIILVEVKRKEMTMEFLRMVEILNQRQGVKTDWTRVYDWRLLRSIIKNEANNDHTSRRQVWRKHLVGLV